MVFERRVTDVGLPVDQHLATTVARKLIDEEAALKLSQEALAKLELN